MMNPIRSRLLSACKHTFNLGRIRHQNNGISHRCFLTALKKPSQLSYQWNQQLLQPGASRFCSTKGSSDPPSSDLPGVQSKGPKMTMVYTCSVCETRSVKVISKESYEKGVVLVRCPGCSNLHLIADRLGWFSDESWDVERLMAEKGQSAKIFNDDNVFEMTEADVIGNRKDDKKDE